MSIERALGVIVLLSVCFLIAFQSPCELPDGNISVECAAK